MLVGEDRHRKGENAKLAEDKAKNSEPAQSGRRHKRWMYQFFQPKPSKLFGFLPFRIRNAAEGFQRASKRVSKPIIPMR